MLESTHLAFCRRTAPLIVGPLIVGRLIVAPLIAWPLIVWMALSTQLLHAQPGTTTVGLNPTNGTPTFGAGLNVQLPSVGWDTGDLLIAEFGTAQNPIKANIGTITGQKNAVVVPPIFYPPPIDDQKFFDGVTADTRSGIRLNAELYGRAGIRAGAALELGGVEAGLAFQSNPQVEIPSEILAGRFFDVTGIGPGLNTNSSLNISPPRLDFNFDLILDIDARGTLELGLYPFAPFSIGDFHLPDIIPDLDLCEGASFLLSAGQAPPDFNICEGNPNHDALLKFPLTLPRPKTPPGGIELPVTQVGEFQIVNPVKAWESQTSVNPATNVLTTTGNTDLVRLAADIDGIIGGVVARTSEFTGGSRDLPSKANPIAKLSYDLIDVKYGPEFGYDYNATIDPTLSVDLTFDRPVLLKNPNGGTAPATSWSGGWDEIPQIALLSGTPVNVGVDFTGFDADLLYESRFTLADYLEIRALEFRLALNFDRLGLDPVTTAALKTALKLPPLGPLLYDKTSILGKSQFDDLPPIELQLLNENLADDDLWDGAFTLTPEPIIEAYLISNDSPLNAAASYLQFTDPPQQLLSGQLANSVIVLGVDGGGASPPANRLDVAPIDYVDAQGGTLDVQGLHVPEDSSYAIASGTGRTFRNLLSVENDGEIDKADGDYLQFSSVTLPLFITGNGTLRIGGQTTVSNNLIQATSIIHDRDHTILLTPHDFPAPTPIIGLDAVDNFGEIESSGDAQIAVGFDLSTGAFGFGTLTNHPTGLITASDGGTIEIDAQIANRGQIIATGAGSRVTFAGSAPLVQGPAAEGVGKIQAKAGGTVHFEQTLLTRVGGQLEVEAAAGSLVQFDKRIDVDNVGNIELITRAGGQMTLNGLRVLGCSFNCDEPANQPGKAVITNHGLLEVASGKNSLRIRIGSLFAEDFDDQIVPIDLVNTGTIRIHHAAELAFDFAIKNYSGKGATFAGGTWELIGDPVEFDNRTPKPTGDPVWAVLDMQVGEVLRDTEVIDDELPLDELTTALKFNAANVLLSGAALFPYFNTVEVNQGGITLDQLQQFHTVGQFENRDGQVAVHNGAGLHVHGPLLINGGSVVVTGAGSILEIVGGHLPQDDGSLARREIEINGGTLTVGSDAEFDYTSGGQTWIVRDRLVDDGNGGEFTEPGVFDLGTRQIVNNPNEIVIEGQGASFDAARHIARNAGSLSIGRGHEFNSLAPRFDNFAGATLSLVGGRFLTDGPLINYGNLVVDDQSHLRASQLRLASGNAQLDGAIEADTIVGAGAALRGEGLFAYDLTMSPGSTLEVEFAGPEVMGLATVDGTLAIVLPEDYAAPDEPGESITYLLLQADEPLFGAFDEVTFDGAVLGGSFGLNDVIVEDAGGGLFRTVRFLASAIELIETLGPPNSRVPEPSTILLLIVPIACGFARRRSRSVNSEGELAAGQRPSGAPQQVVDPRLACSIAISLVFASTSLNSNGNAATFDWDRGAGTDLWSDGANWNQGTAIPDSDDIVSLVGAAPSGAQTIDLDGVEHDVIRVQLGDPNADFAITNGTLGLFLTGGNSLLTLNAGGSLTIDADILFGPASLDPRFNVEPSAEPIVVTGNVTSTAPETTRTVILELTSRNLALEPSVDVSGVISEGPGSKLALRAGFEADSENHRGVVRVSGLNTFTGATTVNGAVLEFNSIANADGTSSALGAPTNAADGRIMLGAFDGTNSIRSSGTLRYRGAGHSSDRELQLAGDGAGATIEASGTGALMLSGGVTVEPSANDQTLTLGGDSSADNTLSGGIGANSGAGVLDLVKTGAGNWTLTDANPFQGGATVEEGVLTFLVNGAHSSSQRTTVGGPNHGTLNVLAGGAMTSGELRIAEAAGSSGAVNVDGHGSTFQVATGVAYVGFNGFGQFGITGGAQVELLDNLTMGNGNDSVGIVTISGASNQGAASQLTVAETLRVGDDGNGTINVTDGGQLVTSAAGNFTAFIGNESGGTGAVVVSGQDSRWQHQGVGNKIEVGNSGSPGTRARLDVLAGGEVQTHDLVVGSSKEGLVTIGGTDSTVVVSGLTNVGDSGKGAMEIRSGGTYSAIGLARVGVNAAGDGRLLVSGADSSLQAESVLIVGLEGSGQFTVEDSAVVTLEGGLVIGNKGVSSGSVDINNATVTADYVSLGHEPSAAGRLTITGGGQLNLTNPSRGVSIATFSQSSGHVTVGDSDTALPISKLTAADALSIAAAGGTSQARGSLTVRPTGFVDVADLFFVGQNAPSVFLEGGVIQAPSYMIAGASSIQFNSGTIRVKGNQTLNATTIAEFGVEDVDAVPTLLEDQRLAIDGVATLTSPLVIDGGTLSIGSTADLSQLQMPFGTTDPARTGALHLTDMGITVAAGGLLGSQLTLASGQTLDVAQIVTLGSDGDLLIEGGKLGAGTLDLSGGGAFSFTAGALEVGAVTGNLNNDGGTLAPGRRLGPATIDGNYTQTAGILEIEVAGTAPDDFDQLAVNGAASINGTLRISSLPDYDGPADRGEQHVFEIVTANSITGSFASITYDSEEVTPGLNYVPQPDPEGVDGLFRSVVATSAAITLTNYLAELGDADGDGSVGAADLASWESNFGADADFSTGDFDNSGTAGGGDFLSWQRNVNSPPIADVTAHAVPEPTAVWLALFAVHCNAIRPGRRRCGVAA